VRTSSSEGAGDAPRESVFSEPLSEAGAGGGSAMEDAPQPIGGRRLLAGGRAGRQRRQGRCQQQGHELQRCHCAMPGRVFGNALTPALGAPVYMPCRVERNKTRDISRPQAT
jgi:hypothetical protein